MSQFFKAAQAVIILVFVFITAAETQDDPSGALQDDPFGECTTHEFTEFMEPSDCRDHGGQMFRLCTPGKHKSTPCIEDASNFCDFCTPGITFMELHNNCTECRSCKECAPDELVETPCSVQDDTVCQPRKPSTVSPAPGEETCPPCPVTQILLPVEPTTQDPSTFAIPPAETPTQCPKCICNCTEECENYPNPHPSSSCPQERSLYIVSSFFIAMVILTIGMIIYVCWLHRDNKLHQGEYEEIINTVKSQNTHIARLEKLLKERGINYIEVCNGVPEKQADVCVGDAAHPDDIEMGIIQPGQHQQDKGDQNENLRSSVPLLDHAASLNSLNMPPNGNPGVTSTPKRKVQREDLGPVSQAGLVDAEVHNAMDQNNSTMDFPGRIINPVYENSLQTNDSIQPGDFSTLPCQKSLGHLPKEDSSDTEPSENDKLLPSGSTQSKSKDKEFIKNAESNGHKDTNTPSKLTHSRPSKLVVDLPIQDSKSPGEVGGIISPKVGNLQEHSLVGPKLGPSPSEEEQTLDKRKDNQTNASKTSSGAIPKNSKVPILASGDAGKVAEVPGSSKKLTNGGQNGHGNRNENRPSKDKIAESLDFQTVAERLTADAKTRLYRQLNMKRATVDQAETSIMSIDFIEKTIAVLEQWKRRKGKSGTVAALIEAIRRAGDNDIADEIEELYS